MSQMQLQPDDPIGPLDWRKVIPFQAVAASDRLGWVGLEAARFRASPAWEYTAPARTHHRLVLVTRPPPAPDPPVGGGERRDPPPTGTCRLGPGGTSGQVRVRRSVGHA